MHYLYVPFTRHEQNHDLVQKAQKWLTAVIADSRQKPRPQIRIHGEQPQCLAGVQRTDKVYVLAHGNPFSNEYVTALPQPETMVVSYEMLADRLKADKLPLVHTVVKLYICSESGNTKVFAENFFCEMQQLGYAQIEVQYYEAQVSVPLPWGDGLYHKDGLHTDTPRGVFIPRFRASQVRKSIK